MHLIDSIRISLRALLSNKLRSSLTMLGIIIGVASVISLMSVGRGTQASINAQFQSLGTNLLYVRPGSTSQSGVRTASGSAATLTYEDAQTLIDPLLAPSVAKVAPERQSNAQVSFGSQNLQTRLLGTTPDYADVTNTSVNEGSFITDDHIENRDMVAVIGSQTASNLFGNIDPLGQNIRISGQLFQVIGVLKSKGGTGMGMQDDVVIMPITTLYSRLSGQRTARGGHVVSTINVQVTSASETASATDEITAILRQRHNIRGTNDDFQISNVQQLLDTLSQVTGIFTILLGSIAGISLLVGGIGIMNIMLVSVTERTREIGIRKAIGAKQRDILMQFLVESGVLSVLGGGVGVMSGWALSKLLGTLNLGGQVLKTVVTPDIIVLAMSVSIIIGLFFGIYPASRAAKLHPIEALRYE